MTSSLSRGHYARPAGIAAATLAGAFLLGYGGIFVWGGNSDSATPIWPANAFVLVMLLRLSRTRIDDIVILSAMLAATLAANLLGGAPTPLTIGYSLVNLVDVVMGLLVVRWMGMPRIKTMVAAGKFTLAVGAGPSLLGALLAAGLVAWHGAGDPINTGA